jgi:hypothetical protein
LICASSPSCPSRNGCVRRFSAAAGARNIRTGASAGHFKLAPDLFASRKKSPPSAVLRKLRPTQPPKGGCLGCAPGSRPGFSGRTEGNALAKGQRPPAL